MKTALFFGSFNPVHSGHLIIAQYILNQQLADKVEFVVSPHNPFKDPIELLPIALRLEILKLSIGDNQNFNVNEIELGLTQPSYTAHTLDAMGASDTEHLLIMGSDTVAGLENWKKPERILRHRILVYKRSGIYTRPYPGHPNIIELDSPLIEISATMIRKMLSRGESVKYLVCKEAEPLLTEYFQRLGAG